jgi:hypothetical protein
VHFISLGSSGKRLLVSARWGYGAYSKFNKASSLVVALFLETCGLLDHRIYRHRICIFGVLEGEGLQKTTRAHEKNLKY